MYPLFATIGLASVVCGGFMIKYFGGHSDIAWSKAVRMNPEVGMNERRVDIHNNRFGFRSLNKNSVNIFPFKFEPMSAVIDKHRFDK